MPMIGRPACSSVPRDAVVVEALQVDGGFARLAHVVEPDFAAQPFRWLIAHGIGYSFYCR